MHRMSQSQVYRILPGSLLRGIRWRFFQNTRCRHRSLGDNAAANSRFDADEAWTPAIRYLVDGFALNPFLAQPQENNRYGCRGQV